MNAQQSLTTALIRTVTAVTALSSFFLGPGCWWLSASRTDCFIPRTNWIELFMVSCYYLHVFDNRNHLDPVWYRTKAPRCSSLQPAHCIKVATVEQQQWTNRLDISNTADRAGEFRVAAGANADVLFCSVWRQKQLLTCCFVQSGGSSNCWRVVLFRVAAEATADVLFCSE